MKPSRYFGKFAPGLGSLAVLTLLTPLASAQTTVTWVGNVSPNWSVANGFSAVPTTGNTLLFNAAGIAGTTLNDDIAALTVGTATTDGIDFSAAASAYSIAPGTATNTITLASGTNGISDLSLNAQTISVPLALASTQTINVGSMNGSLTLSGAISGSGFGITKTGSGLLTLGGTTNTFSGPVVVSGGTLAVGTDTALGSTTSITLNGGTLRNTLAFTLGATRGIALGASGGTVDVVSGTLIYNGVISGTTGSLTKTGGGSFTIGGTNTYAGSTNINQGSLGLSFANATVTNNIVQPTSALVMGGYTTALGSVTPAFTLSGAQAVLTVSSKNNTSNAQTFGGVTFNRGTSGITTSPTGASGAVLLNLGTLAHSAGGAVNFTFGGTLSGTNAITTTTATTTTNGIFGGWATYGGSVYATNDGNGNIVAYNGYTTITSGSQIASDQTTNVQISGATTSTLTTANGATTDINTLSVSSAGAATTTVTVGTAGTGSTGILRLGASGGLMVGSTTGSSALTIGNTAGNGTLTAGGANTLNAAGEINIYTPATSSAGGVVVINSNIKDNGTGAVTVSYSSAGAGSSLTLSGTSNTFSGGLNINNGRVSLSNVTAAGSGPINVLEGGILNVTPATGTVGNNITIAGNGNSSFNPRAAITLVGATLSGTITLANDANILGGSTTASVLSGQIMGNANLFVGSTTGNQAGTVNFSNTANNYTGNTIITSTGTGTTPVVLGLGASNVIPDGAGFGNVLMVSTTSTSPAVLSLNGFNETINGLVSGGTNNFVRNNSATANSTLTVGGGNATAVFAGYLTNGAAGTLGLTKTGTGMQTLTNAATASDYTGTTTVNGGVLAVDSAGSTTARLSGTTGIVLNTGGTLLMTNSVTATGSTDRINNAAPVTLAGGMLNLGGLSEGAAGTTGIGALTLTTTSTIDFGPTGSSNVIQFAGVGTHTTGTLLQIIDWEGTAGSPGTDKLLFAGAATDFTNQYASTDVSFNGVAGYAVTGDLGGYYEVYSAAVPEASTWTTCMVFLGLTGLSLYRRRRRARTA